VSGRTQHYDCTQHSYTLEVTVP